MSLSLNSGFTYTVIAPGAQPVRTPPVQPRQWQAGAAEVEPGSERSAKRSADYTAALRELRAEQQSPRQHLALRTYLQVAHYEGNFQLVDVYT